MAQIWTMGEIIVEIMRNRINAPLDAADTFIGPFPSGAPAIFIDTVARLGHRAAIIGGVGQDDFGKCILDRLHRDGVDCTHIMQSKTHDTGCAFVTYFDDGSRKFLFHIDHTAAVKVQAPAVNTFENADFFHVMGCSLMANAKFGQSVLQAMHAAKECGAKISFDPNIRPELLKDPSCADMIDAVLQNTSILMPGVSEFLSLTHEKTVEDAIAACWKLPHMEIVVVKNGSKGCTVYTREQIKHFGIYQVNAVDATGAGDSFDAAFLCGLCDGLSIEQCAKQASAAAALNTASFGPMEGHISIETVRQLTEEKELS